MGGFICARAVGECIVETGHGKQPVGVEHVAQHLAIAGLENVQRQQSLGKKDRVRQGHYGHGLRHMQRLHAPTIKLRRGIFNHR